MLLGLSLLGLRGSRPSPVPALVAGALACILLAGAGQPWPGGLHLAALYPRLADHVWMLGIARVPAAGQPATPWAEQTTMLPLALAALATAPMRVPVDPPPQGCACRPEIEIPALGWRLGADQIDVSAWTRSPPAGR